MVAAISPYDSTQNPPLGKISSVPMYTVWDPEFHTEENPLEEFPVIKQNRYLQAYIHMHLDSCQHCCSHCYASTRCTCNSYWY